MPKEVEAESVAAGLRSSNVVEGVWIGCVVLCCVVFCFVQIDSFLTSDVPATTTIVWGLSQ